MTVNRNKPTCRICGRKLRGVTLDYGNSWVCSDCVEDKTDVLHCEEGCKVVASHTDWGMNYDKKRADEYLIRGGMYEVNSLNIGSYISYIELKDIPGRYFNSVQFERIS